MILAGLMGSLAASGGGAPPTLTLVSTAYSPVNEGQEQSITVEAANWNNSLIYWRVTNSSNTNLTSQVNTVSGSFYGGTGTNQHNISFTFTADATTEGPLSYYVKFSSSEGANDILIIGPETCNDTSFGLGQYTFNGTLTDWAETNATVATYNAYTYPDETSGSLHTLTGTQYVRSQGWSASATICFNLWFYPTANNKIIIGELGQADVNGQFHYSVLEIDSTNHLKGRVWQMGGVFTEPEVTSTGTVTLNAWNHVYLYFNNATTTCGMSLNNEAAVTQGSVTRNLPEFAYWGIGLTDAQNMGSSARYQGKFDGLVISTTLTGSNYTSTKAKYLPPLSLNWPTSGNNFATVQNTQSEWALGSVYTIEFWSKSIRSSNTIQTVMSQGDSNNNIDIGYQEGKLMFANTKWTAIPEPTPGGKALGAYNIGSPGGWNGVGTPGSWTNLATTGGTGTGLTINVAGATGGYVNAISIVNPGSGYTEGDTITATGESSVSFNINVSAAVWTHVAIVRNGTGSGNPVTVYYNGVSQGTFVPGALTNGSNDLILGRRGSNTFQYFKGKLALIRISNAAKYLANFDPSFSYGVEVDTKLMLGNNPTIDSTGTHPISLGGSVSTGADFPSFQSLVFNYPQQDYLVTPASADWNLGTTWTIEFWINANNGSLDGINIPGGQWGLFNQGGWFGGLPANSIIIGLAGGNLTIGQGNTDDAIEFAEPTAQQWTHVAVVNNGGGSAQKVYYNGVEQAKVTGNYLSNGWTNATDPLYIGRLAPGYNSPFDGKMAMIRISNTAKYLTTFSATTTYGVEADTVLFLDKVNPLLDAKAHTIFNNGVTTSTSFPS